MGVNQYKEGHCQYLGGATNIDEKSNTNIDRSWTGSRKGSQTGSQTRLMTQSQTGPWTGSLVESINSVARSYLRQAKKVLWKFLSRGFHQRVFSRLAYYQLPGALVARSIDPVWICSDTQYMHCKSSYDMTVDLLAISHWTIDVLIHAPIGLY